MVHIYTIKFCESIEIMNFYKIKNKLNQFKANIFEKHMISRNREKQNINEMFRILINFN